MSENWEEFERRAMAKTLELCKGQSPAFNIVPTLEAVKQVLSFAGADIVIHERHERLGVTSGDTAGSGVGTPIKDTDRDTV